MKKSKGYAPYIFAFVINLSITISDRLFFKSGLLLNWILFFLILVGLWRLIEWLLTRSKNKWVQWAYVLLGIVMYSLSISSLDFYVLHRLMNFTGANPWSFTISLLLLAAVETIFIVSMKWARAREKAEIENLRLQAENIEAKFQLVKQKINPDFLFHCLTTLQTMVRSDNPESEEYILKLANVYRQTLKTQKNNNRLSDELALLQTYMFLMRSGREKRISFEVVVSDASLNYQLPVFALQLLGDNCIKDNEFSESHPLHIRIFQKEAHSITLSHNAQPKAVQESLDIDIAHLEMCYAMEGIENGVCIEHEPTTYSTTLKLF